MESYYLNNKKTVGKSTQGGIKMNTMRNNKGEAGNELVQFLLGLGMLVCGVWFFLSKMTVGFHGLGTYYWGSTYLGRVPTGAIFVPLILGIILLFYKPNVFAKIVTFLGALIIIASVILALKIDFATTRGYEFVVMLVLMFGGLGLLVRVLLKKPATADTAKKTQE